MRGGGRRQGRAYLQNEKPDLPRDTGVLPDGVWDGRWEGESRPSQAVCVPRARAEPGEIALGLAVRPAAIRAPAPGSTSSLGFHLHPGKNLRWRMRACVVVHRCTQAGSGQKVLDAGKGTGRPGQDGSPQEPVLRAGEEAAGGA